MPRIRKAPKRPYVWGKTCDGSAADYRRHSRRGEDPCPESRKNWAAYVRYYRMTGIYPEASNNIPDPKAAHPFMFRRSGRMKKKAR